MKLQHMLPTLAAMAFLSSAGLFAQSASMASFDSARGRFAEDKSIRPLDIKVPKESLTDLRRRLAATRRLFEETVNERSHIRELLHTAIDSRPQEPPAAFAQAVMDVDRFTG